MSCVETPADRLAWRLKTARELGVTPQELRDSAVNSDAKAINNLSRQKRKFYAEWAAHYRKIADILESEQK